MPGKAKKWISTKLSPEYFELFNQKKYDPESNVPRVTKVFDDRSEEHFRLKRRNIREEDSLREAEVGKELNKIGITAPMPELIDGKQTVLITFSKAIKNFQRKNWVLLYPEIPGQQLSVQLKEALGKGDLSVLKKLRKFAEKDSLIAQHAAKENKPDLLLFERSPKHIIEKPDGELAYIDVDPLSRNPFEQGFTEKEALEHTAKSLLFEAIPVLKHLKAKKLMGKKEIRKQALKELINHYFDGMQDQVQNKTLVQEIRHNVLKALSNEKKHFAREIKISQKQVQEALKS